MSTDASPAADIRITSGSPTPEELAAVTAVLSVALDEFAHDERRRPAPPVSAWDRSRRAIRGVVPGQWRSFSG